MEHQRKRSRSGAGSRELMLEIMHWRKRSRRSIGRSRAGAEGRRLAQEVGNWRATSSAAAGHQSRGRRVCNMVSVTVSEAYIHDELN